MSKLDHDFQQLPVFFCKYPHSTNVHPLQMRAVADDTMKALVS